MIDFKDELSKYKPVMDVDEVQNSVNDELKDIMDMLQYISQKVVKEE